MHNGRAPLDSGYVRRRFNIRLKRMFATMSNTKERIFDEALKLFSKNGYEASSVRDISGKLGMTQAALYKHYKNKQAIFDSIVNRMKENERTRAGEYNMPAITDDPDSPAFKNLSVSQLKLYSLIQFLYWTEDEFASSCRKMLCLEQYHNYQAGFLYQQYLVNGQFMYMEKIISELIRQGQWAEGDAWDMAVEYYGPILAMIMIYDGTEDKESVKAKLKAHLANITKKYKK